MKIEQFIIPGRTPLAEQGNQDRSFEVPPQTGGKGGRRLTRGAGESDLNVGYAAALHRCIIASSVCVVLQQTAAKTAARLALRSGDCLSARYS